MLETNGSRDGQMKQAYFTRENIGAKAREMLEKVRAHGHRPDMIFRPECSVLLVLDMQDFFLNDSSHAFIPAAKAIIPGVGSLIKGYNTAGRPVIFTRHLNTAADAKLMAKWWRDLISHEDPLSEITKELDTSAGSIITKTQYDAFYATALESMLEECGVTQLVICGVMTNLCCETTARSAFVRGMEVFFPVDGTATYNQRYHISSLLNLAHGFAVPVLVDEVLAALGGRDAS